VIFSICGKNLLSLLEVTACRTYGHNSIACLKDYLRWSLALVFPMIFFSDTRFSSSTALLETTSATI
jgi:hypothetical protein